MSSGFNLNIDNYSEEELMELLNIRKPITEEKVDQAIEELMGSMESTHGTNKFQMFLLDAKNRLLDEEEANESDTESSDGSESNFVIDKQNMVESNLILKHDIHYDKSLPNDLLNIIKRKTTKLNMHINSANRDDPYSTSSTNFTYTLPYTLHNVMSLRLRSCVIPDSIYLFTEQNNSFTIMFHIDSSGDGEPDTSESHEIVLPVGTLTNTQLETYLNNAFHKALSGGSGIVFKCLINQFTNQLIFYLDDTTTATVINYTLDFSDSDCGTILGFNTQKDCIYTVNASDTVTYNFDTYDGAIQTSGPYKSCINRYVFIVFDDYNKNVRANTIIQNNDFYVNNNIIGHFIIYKSGTGCVRFEIYKDVPRMYFGPVSIERVNIRLVDENGKDIDLQNEDFSFIVEVETDYS